METTSILRILAGSSFGRAVAQSVASDRTSCCLIEGRRSVMVASDAFDMINAQMEKAGHGAQVDIDPKFLTGRALDAYNWVQRAKEVFGFKSVEVFGDTLGIQVLVTW